MQTARDRLCPGTHLHRPIGRQTVVSNPLSKYTEQYPVKFARQVARVLLHVQGFSAFVTEPNHSEHPTEKRCLSQKMESESIARRFSGINWQTVMALADRLAPRVGTRLVDSGQLLQDVQDMCPNHQVRHLVACRGTD